MNAVSSGLAEVISLLTGGNSEVYEITLLTMLVSGTASIISVFIGLPLGLWLALKEFPGKKVWLSLLNFGMGLPPVVVGLLVSLMLWRYGPLGDLQMMYTPLAMIVSQTIIASPIVAGLTFAAIGSLNPKLRLQLLALGATGWQVNWLLIREARLGLFAAVIAGFGRAVAEVGASMMVGGNIKGETRVLTTATVMEVGKGNYDTALALSFILLLVAYAVILLLTWLQHDKGSIVRRVL